jgi:hypothetical protein
VFLFLAWLRLFLPFGLLARTRRLFTGGLGR